MGDHFQIGDKVFCVVFTSLPSEADLFGRWVIGYGEVVTVTKSEKRGLIYELNIKKFLGRKRLSKKDVILPEERVFKNLGSLKSWLTTELIKVIEEEKKEIDLVVKNFKNIL